MMSSCIVCGADRQIPFYDGLLRCGECGHVVADLALGEAAFHALYARSYFFGDEYLDYIADRPVLQRNFGLRLKTLGRFINPARHQRLLEIGCAYGFFLDLARHEFATAQGIDVSADAIRYARSELGVDAVEGDFLAHDFGPQRFDVVCLWDTIEHLRSPHLYIAKAASLLEPGGFIAITTGDIESFVARWQKNRWRLIHPPTHVHYFSRRSLRRLLERYGFSVVYDRYTGFYRSIDNTAYNLFVLRAKLPKLYRLVHLSGLGRIGFPLNLYDISYVIAQRL